MKTLTDNDRAKLFQTLVTMQDKVDKYANKLRDDDEEENSMFNYLMAISASIEELIENEYYK